MPKEKRTQVQPSRKKRNGAGEIRKPTTNKRRTQPNKKIKKVASLSASTPKVAPPKEVAYDSMVSLFANDQGDNERAKQPTLHLFFSPSHLPRLAPIGTDRPLALRNTTHTHAAHFPSSPSPDVSMTGAFDAFPGESHRDECAFGSNRLELGLATPGTSSSPFSLDHDMTTMMSVSSSSQLECRESVSSPIPSSLSNSFASLTSTRSPPRTRSTRSKPSPSAASRRVASSAAAAPPRHPADIPNADGQSPMMALPENIIRHILSHLPRFNDNLNSRLVSKSFNSTLRSANLMRSYILEDGWRDSEAHYRPHVSNFMSLQTQVDCYMRAILVDWLMDVAVEYQLNPEALFLAVNYLDRFLSLQQVSKQQLQVLGAACILIAAKYEEIYPPPLDEFVYISDNSFSREELIQMEILVLSVLEFQMSAVTSRNFIKQYQTVCQFATNDELTHLSNYIVELTLLHDGFNSYLPSQMAVASCFVACQMLGAPSLLVSALETASKYSLDDPTMGACVRDTILYFKTPSHESLKACNLKYAAEKFGSVYRHRSTPAAGASSTAASTINNSHTTTGTTTTTTSSSSSSTTNSKVVGTFPSSFANVTNIPIVARN